MGDPAVTGAIVGAAAALLVTGITAWVQRRHNIHQIRDQALVDSFSELFAGLATNRRARLYDDTDEGRRSSAAFYAAALRISVLADPNTLEALADLMATHLRFDADDSDGSIAAFSALHNRIRSEVALNGEAVNQTIVDRLFFRHRRGPQVWLGELPDEARAPTPADDEQRLDDPDRRRQSAASRPVSAPPSRYLSQEDRHE